MAEDQRDTSRSTERAFGRLLRRWRQERGLSQERLAELSGCDRSYLSRLERGINAPSIAVVVELGIALNIRPSDLFASIGIEIEAAQNKEQSY